MTNAEFRKISHILITHHYDGHHVIRRNDRFWADLSTDLIIKVVMRNFRTTDGLTRGSGMNKSARLVWLLWTWLVGETQADLDIASFFFSYTVHVIKLIFCPKKETHYANG